MNIDYSVKDRVLNSLCKSLPAEQTVQINLTELLKSAEVDFDTLNAVLTYFQRIGFIEDLNCRRVALYLNLRTEAFDSFNRGGFTAQEELLKKEIEKLLYEIESLKPSMPEKVNTITSIAANIATALGLFLSRQPFFEAP